MTTESPDWLALQEQTAVLDEPQFSRDDVLRATGLNRVQLANTLNRDLVHLSTRHNPGKGRRRLFTGGDILQLIAAHALSGIGVPMRMLWLFADQINRRAIALLTGIALEKNYGLILYPLDGGADWRIVATHDGAELDTETLPVAFGVLQVDALIEQTFAKLEAMIADQPIPDFSPPPPPEAEEDPLKMYAVDPTGERVMVGLTVQETAEYEALQSRSLASRLSENAFPWASVEEKRREQDRLIELFDKHERARQERLARTAKQREAAAKKR